MPAEEQSSTSSRSPPEAAGEAAPEAAAGERQAPQTKENGGVHAQEETATATATATATTTTATLTTEPSAADTTSPDTAREPTTDNREEADAAGSAANGDVQAEATNTSADSAEAETTREAEEDRMAQAERAEVAKFSFSLDTPSFSSQTLGKFLEGQFGNMGSVGALPEMLLSMDGLASGLTGAKRSADELSSAPGDDDSGESAAKRARGEEPAVQEGLGGGAAAVAAPAGAINVDVFPIAQQANPFADPAQQLQPEQVLQLQQQALLLQQQQQAAAGPPVTADDVLLQQIQLQTQQLQALQQQMVQSEAAAAVAAGQAGTLAQQLAESDGTRALTKVDPKSYIDITEYLNMPQFQAAKALGIPASTLSKRWREAAHDRKWPYRTVAKLDKKLMTLLHNVPQGPDAPPLSEKLEQTLSELLKQRQEELVPVSIRL